LLKDGLAAEGGVCKWERLLGGDCGGNGNQNGGEHKKSRRQVGCSVED
jgi:hypothetical protein